jgi:ABC-type sulfate/molybdate transport systems ATPase subunit
VHGLAVRDAVVTRGTFTVQASLRAGPGEVVALVGPNGTGKTTLLHAIAGLVPLSAGEIRLGTQVLDSPSDGTWVPAPARRVGLVPQHHDLFGHLSALENAAFGLRARGTPRAQARAEAHRWLTLLDVPDLANVRADRLSGGQAQRVAIARACAARPAVLLLDEPFAALDVTIRGQAADMVREAVRTLDVPAVLVSHDTDEVAATAQTVVHLTR